MWVIYTCITEKDSDEKKRYEMKLNNWLQKHKELQEQVEMGNSPALKEQEVCCRTEELNTVGNGWNKDKTKRCPLLG